MTETPVIKIRNNKNVNEAILTSTTIAIEGKENDDKMISAYPPCNKEKSNVKAMTETPVIEIRNKKNVNEAIFTSPTIAIEEKENDYKLIGAYPPLNKEKNNVEAMTETPVMKIKRIKQSSPGQLLQLRKRKMPLQSVKVNLNMIPNLNMRRTVNRNIIGLDATLHIQKMMREQPLTHQLWKILYIFSV